MILRHPSVETCLVPGSKYTLPGENQPADGGYLFSNDGRLPPLVLIALGAKTRGISLEIGQGALFSTIDQHNLQPVMVDSSPHVVDFCKLVGDAILNATTAEDATERIIEQGGELAARAGRSSVSHTGTIASYIAAEASDQRMGKLHWTRAKRFPLVKAALQERPPAYVVSDIRNPTFAKQLQHMSRTYGKVEFFNATNLHSPLSDIHGQTMDFLRNLPFSRRAVVLYSTKAGGVYSSYGDGEFLSLQRHDVRGISEYIRRAHALMPYRKVRTY